MMNLNLNEFNRFSLRMTGSTLLVILFGVTRSSAALSPAMDESFFMICYKQLDMNGGDVDGRHGFDHRGINI